MVTTFELKLDRALSKLDEGVITEGIMDRFVKALDWVAKYARYLHHDSLDLTRNVTLWLTGEYLDSNILKIVGISDVIVKLIGLIAKFYIRVRKGELTRPDADNYFQEINMKLEKLNATIKARQRR